jgi:lipoprotein-anchoring transpeptidase ErfK/SrfK
MYFDGQISLHGAYWHDMFGYPMSHGCVNMSISDAHWLFDWTAATPNAAVYVWASRGMS